MLKTARIGILVLLLSAPSAWSQTPSPRPEGEGSAAAEAAQLADPATGARGPRLRAAEDEPARRDALPPTKSAEFRFKQGDLEVNIRCAEDEAIKPCADAALTLMDKFGSVAATLPAEPPAP